jgi:hypothetical protein
LAFAQQLSAPSPDHRSALPRPLAGGTVLPLDQTALAHQAFYGTSENAVKTQVWVAISVYVLVAIVKKQLDNFRKNPDFTGAFPLQRFNDPEQLLYLIAIIRLIDR